MSRVKYVTKYFNQLKKHENYEHEKLDSNESDKSFKSPEPKLLKDQYKHAEKECQQCGKRFSGKISLKSHIKNIHEIERELKKCHYCNETFRFEVGLKSHIKTVHSKKKSDPGCDQCDQKFKTRQDLQSHMRNVHSGWKCE